MRNRAFTRSASRATARAPTFLLLTGYEQARSVAAALAGDMAAADGVHLVLPDTGICVTDFEEAACCRGPAPAESDACCVADAVAKDVGEIGRIGARALTSRVLIRVPSGGLLHKRLRSPSFIKVFDSDLSLHIEVQKPTNAGGAPVRSLHSHYIALRSGTKAATLSPNVTRLPMAVPTTTNSTRG